MQSIKEHNLKANHNKRNYQLAFKHVCMQSIKEHNLKANHNCINCNSINEHSVCNLSKNTIWKQITTAPGTYVIVVKSVCNLSKNTIWKQITTPYEEVNYEGICMQSIKEHNLKANHNSSLLAYFASCLYAIYQRTQSESKSQLKRVAMPNRMVCMQSIKEHNLKANHNLHDTITVTLQSVCNLSKNTIWKQITTMGHHNNLGQFLYAIYQRTQSESKSQLCRI